MAHCRSLGVLTALLLVLADVAFGADPPAARLRFLDAIPAKGADNAYSVPPGSDLVLPFTVEKGGKLELYLSQFRGESGDVVAVQSSIGESGEAANQKLAFSAKDGEIIRLRLKSPVLPNPGKYSGTLTLLANGRAIQTERLQLTRASAPIPAKLAVDWKSQSGYEGGAFTFQVRNGSADWPARGLYLRLVDATYPVGNKFDPRKNLELTLNGARATDLWSAPSKDSSERTIEPNRQVVIAGQLTGTDPGEYVIKIAPGAVNAPVDNENVVTLKLYSRHSWTFPVLVLLLAILLSFVATKGLESQRRRAGHLAKINDVRKRIPGHSRDSLPAVAARSILKQAEDRNQSWFRALFGQDTTTAQIEKAERLARIVEKAASLRDRIARAGWTPLSAHRAGKYLMDVFASINPETMDAAVATKVEADLAALENWFDPNQRDTLYLGAFKSDLDGLLAQARPEMFDVAQRSLIDQLRAAIEAGKAAGAPLPDIVQMERAYGILKVLWERNREQDGEALRILFDLLDKNPQVGLEEFFREADGLAWRRLKPADFEFVSPAARELEPRHEFELIQFSIAPKERKLGNNFLFKHRVEYVWTLELLDAQKGGTVVTEQRTNEPRVTQYAPRQGQYRMSVRLSFEGRQAEKGVSSETLSISRSTDYGVASIFRFTEIAGLGIATILAVISGLSTYYVGKPAFGSISDYFALFIWGAGVDQTKNFIQQLGATSKA